MTGIFFFSWNHHRQYGSNPEDVKRNHSKQRSSTGQSCSHLLDQSHASVSQQCFCPWLRSRRKAQGSELLASHGVSPSRRDIYKIRLSLTLPESNSLPKLGVSELTSKLSTKPIFNWQGNRVKMLTERHLRVPAF